MKSEDEILLKEHDSILRMYSDGERTFAMWDSVFVVTEGILISAFAYLIKKIDPINSVIIDLINFMVIIIGITISLFWFIIQSRAYVFSDVRKNLLRDIEDKLRKQNINFTPIKNEDEKIKERELSKYQEISTWKLRKYLPWIFIVFWIILLLYILFRLVSNIMTLSEYEWIQILISFTGIIIAGSLALVAYSSLQDAKRDRRFRLLDAKLQKAYYPIFEIIRKAKIRTKEPGTTVLQSLEKRDIRNIITKYGYYLDSKLLGLIIRRIVDTGDSSNTYQESEIGEIYNILSKRTEELRKQLEELIE